MGVSIARGGGTRGRGTVILSVTFHVAGVLGKLGQIL